MPVITKFSDLDLTKEYTYSDYLLWQFSERVELIRGYIKKMSPAPNRAHQTVAKNITYKLMQYFEYKSYNLFFAPFDVRLPLKKGKKNETVVQPDILVVCDETKLDDKGCNGSPDLIVEILSPNNSKHDITTKFNLYQEAGVLEYWIIDPTDKILFVYTLLEGIYIGLQPQTEGENIKSKLFPEMQIALDDIFSNL